MNKEEMIKRYYQSWVVKDVTLLKGIFSSDCVYNECFGEEYHGESQIYKWFDDWNKKGSITEWSIRKFYHCNDIVIVESLFKCKMEKEFVCDAVALIRFNSEGLIDKVIEYWAKYEHHCPYGNN